MAKKTLNIGTTANDGQGDTLRDAAGKINDNFSELFAAAFDSAGGGSGYLTPENINTLSELNAILATGGSDVLVDSATIQARIDAGGGGASFTDLAGLNSNLSDATLSDSAEIQTRIDDATAGLTSFDSTNISTLADLNTVANTTLVDSATIQSRIDDAAADLGARVDSAALPEFFKFMVGDKVLIVQTGQSNPQGGEVRRAAAGVDTWENNRVWDWQWSVRTGAQNSVDLNDPSHANWGWVNPTTTQAIPTNLSGIIAYMGYIGGNTGNQVYSLANEIQLSTGMDVYVVNMSQGGSDISWWEGSGQLGLQFADILESHLIHILGNNTGVDFGGKPGPDITTWGQSEANFYAPLGAANALEPSAWATRLAAVFDTAKSTANSWIADGYTKIFLTEATDYINWNGLPQSGSYTGIPYRWNGANIAATEYGDDCTLVSSRGIEHGDDSDMSMVSAFPSAGAPTHWVHFSGDGNDAYGRRIADVILGREREFKDTDLDVLHGGIDSDVSVLNTRLSAVEGVSTPSFIQSLYGVNGKNTNSFTHFSNLAAAGVYNTEGGLLGSEPIRTYFGGAGEVKDDYNLIQPGHIRMKTAGTNAGAATEGCTGIEMSELFPIFQIQNTSIPGTSVTAGGIDKITFGAIASYITLNEEGDPGSDQNGERYVFRLGNFKVISSMNSGSDDYQETGIYFEFRWESPNWFICIKDTDAPSVSGTSGANIEIDTGIPVSQYSSVFSPPGERLQFVHDLVGQTVTFSINGSVVGGGPISTTNFDGVSPPSATRTFNTMNSLGAYVLRYEGSDPAEVDLDLMFAEIEHTYDNWNLSDFL